MLIQRPLSKRPYLADWQQLLQLWLWRTQRNKSKHGAWPLAAPQAAMEMLVWRPSAPMCCIQSVISWKDRRLWGCCCALMVKVLPASEWLLLQGHNPGSLPSLVLCGRPTVVEIIK